MTPATNNVRAFTLVDVLVTLSIILILIGFLAPAMTAVRETTRRVICASNVRQIGIGMALYAEDHRGFLPPTNFAEDPAIQKAAEPEMTVLARISQLPTGRWDGLGILYSEEYLSSPQVFYCPSHRSGHNYDRYALDWQMPLPSQVVMNFQYRGAGPSNRHRFALLPPHHALIADSLRARDEYSHRSGTNLLRADLGTIWFDDEGQRVSSLLPNKVGDPDSSLRVDHAWQELDLGSNRTPAVETSGSNPSFFNRFP